VEPESSNTLAITLGVVGAVVVLIAIAAAIFALLFFRKRRQRRTRRQSQVNDTLASSIMKYHLHPCDEYSCDV
jgi:nitrate reductase gamma subunit